MTLKSLWTIIVKIAGLYITWQSLLLLPQLLMLVSLGMKDHENTQIFTSELLLLTQGGICLLTAWGCIFKTDWIIKKLNLENGLDEEILKLNVHRSVVLKIIIIVSGVLLMVDGFPMLCNHVLTYLQRSNSYNTFKDNPSTPWVIFSSLKIVIGYCMTAYSRLIINFIELKRKG